MTKIYLMVFLLLIFLVNNSYAGEIVSITETYTYEIMNSNIKHLQEKYPDLLTYHSIGKTKYNREIWVIKVGHGKTAIMLNASIHAREWMTTCLLMKMIEEYTKAYYDRKEIDGFNAREILDNLSIWFIPMLNPDGVTLQQRGLNAFPAEIHQQLIEMNDGKTSFKRWKANLDGIDLNYHFPLEGKSKVTTVSKPYYRSFKGYSPLEALEVKYFVDLIDEVKPEILVNYHSSGNVIFWYTNFAKKNCLDLIKEFASLYSNYSGYDLYPATNQTGNPGLQEFFIDKYNKPSITIEIGSYAGETNVPVDNFPDIWKRNRSAGLLIAEKIIELN